MSSFALFVSASPADSAGGWQARWQLDGSDIGETIAVPLEQAQVLREFTRSFERAFDHRGPDGRAPIPHFPADAIAAVGDQLYQLCCAPVWDEVKARTNGSDHRLVVHTHLADALNLPWELLPLGHDGVAIGCDRAWSLYRTPLDELPDDGAAPAGPLKILFLAAAPIDQGQLDYEREEDAILRATDELRGAVLHIAELGSFDELKKLVAQTKPHVVHLSGHGSVDDGGTGRFCFEDERGRTDAVTANRLVDEVFRGSGVRCVFLNACQTSQAAVSGLCQEMVAAGLPLALGWAASVADDRATRFAETFYRELLAGDPVPAAVAVARLELQKQGLVAQAHHGQDVQEATYLLPQLYAAAAVGLMFDRSLPEQPYEGPRTRYEMLPGGVEGLREGFVGRRREQQTLIPDLRSGQITVALLHGVGGQGKSTLATRVANRLAADGYRIVAVKANKRTDETPAGCAARTVQELMDELRRAFVKAGRDDVLAVLQNDKLELPMRLELAVDYLREVQLLLVLDNFEDVLDLETLEIQDEALAAFYRRLTGEHLTAGSRAIVTCRYVPAGTPTAARLVRVCDTLPDFSESDFFKFLNREPAVAERMRRGDLPRSVLEKLFGLVGGTPRFLNVVRDLLKTYAVEQLGEELAGAAGLIGEAREKYLRDIFGPKLFALLGADTQRVLTHLAVSELPLPADGIAAVTELDETQVTAALAQAVRYGLVQDFADDNGPTLYLPPGLWRPWLSVDERLAADRLAAAHAVLAQFWQAAYEADRERELCVSIVAELEACRHHARHGDRPALFCWGSVRLAGFLTRYSEFREARRVMREVPESDRDLSCWHQLGRAETFLANLREARQHYDRALAAADDGSPDQQNERATVLHNLATIDLREGSYAGAREKFQKALTIKQQIGDRAGEAKTWHQLATVDVHEGSYAEAREKFQKSLTIKQQIGDRAGEAATWHQLASIDLDEGSYAEAREKFQSR